MGQEYVHLEHDGKILLVNADGIGPVSPVAGRSVFEGPSSQIRLPTITEVDNMGIEWSEKRSNRIVFGDEVYKVTYGTPKIPWPEHWAWKDSLASDSAVDPVARESVYRTLHRVVSKVIITNSKGDILMAKVSRGFFTGCWTLPGGFVDYAEHPREAAEREALEELGVTIEIPDPMGECGIKKAGEQGNVVQSEIFNEEGINWVSFTYKCEDDLGGQEVVPKDDEIEEAKWFSREEALSLAVSLFDIEAIEKLV